MSLFEEQGLACQAVDMVRRCITNRASGAEMHRRWLQATFVKGPCQGSHQVGLLWLPQCCEAVLGQRVLHGRVGGLCRAAQHALWELVPCTCRREAELHGCAQTAACRLRWAPEWLTGVAAAAGFRAWQHCGLLKSEVPAEHRECPHKSA